MASCFCASTSPGGKDQRPVEGPGETCGHRRSCVCVTMQPLQGNGGKLESILKCQTQVPGPYQTLVLDTAGHRPWGEAVFLPGHLGSLPYVYPKPHTSQPPPQRQVRGFTRSPLACSPGMEEELQLINSRRAGFQGRALQARARCGRVQSQSPEPGQSIPLSCFRTG